MELTSGRWGAVAEKVMKIVDERKEELSAADGRKENDADGELEAADSQV